MVAIDDNPQWTEDDFAKARRASEAFRDNPYLLSMLVKSEPKPWAWFFALKPRPAAYVAFSPYAVIGLLLMLASWPAGMMVLAWWAITAEFWAKFIMR